MHNLDRTMFEAHEIGHGETAEQEQEDFLGILGSLLGQSGGTHETETETEAGETGELELAAELLEVRGIGPAKARQFGKETLTVVRKFGG